MTGVALTLGGLAVVVPGVVSIRRGSDGLGFGLLVGGNLVIVVGDMMVRNWVFAGLSFACAAACAWCWRRRKRKKSPRTIGAKSRALVAAIVARAREAARPRAVLRPVPGGAR